MMLVVFGRICVTGLRGGIGVRFMRVIYYRLARRF
jgi:hypothetical protein